MSALTCAEVAHGALRQPAKTAGSERYFHCPRHDDRNPSLQINTAKDCGMCGPCDEGGNPWQLAAFIAGLHPDNKAAVTAWLRERGLLNDNGGGKRIVATYDYTDADGKLLYQKVRYEPKSFAFRRPDSTGGWIWGLGGISPVLFNLPEVIKAKAVLVLEGEKDCETARKLGLVATTSGSVGSWHKEFAEILRVKRVANIADADEPGRKYARQVAADLVGGAESVRLLELPDAKDLTEWVEKGGTREKLLEIIKATPPLTASAQPATLPSEVIGAVEQFLTRYLVLPGRAALPLACWVTATYFYESFDSFPYLAILSPVKRCGKTRLAEVLNCVALNPVLTGDITTAALFRLVDKGECTMLLDEAEALKDKKNERAQALVSILNSGYRQGAYVYRCVPPKNELQRFKVYGPKAVIAIGSLPATVFDRSLVIQMRHKRADEKVARFLRRWAKAESEPLRSALQELANRTGEISEVYESMPELSELSDRDEEIWQPLFAVCAVLAPQRVGELREAAIALSRGKAESDVDDSLSLRLLADIRELVKDFDGNVSSAELVSKLKDLPESSWGEPGRELTQNRLAKILRPFGVSSRDIRLGGKVQRGYLRTELEAAFTLYVGSQSATRATTQ